MLCITQEFAEMFARVSAPRRGSSHSHGLLEGARSERASNRHNRFRVQFHTNGCVHPAGEGEGLWVMTFSCYELQFISLMWRDDWIVGAFLSYRHESTTCLDEKSEQNFYRSLVTEVLIDGTLPPEQKGNARTQLVCVFRPTASSQRKSCTPEQQPAVSKAKKKFRRL